VPPLLAKHLGEELKKIKTNVVKITKGSYHKVQSRKQKAFTYSKQAN
jgi:hypothetical protein